MYHLEVHTIGGEIKNFPIGEKYDIVAVDSADVLMKGLSYEVIKAIKGRNRISLTKTYLLSPILTVPLDMEGIGFGVKVDRYEIHSESEAPVIVLPKRDFIDKYEAFDFWKCLESIKPN